MKLLFFAIIIAVLVATSLLALDKSFRHLRRCYDVGMSVWAGLLPLAALAGLVLVLLVNLYQKISPFSELLRLPGFLQPIEIFILFCLLAVFMTHLGNIAAAAMLVYILERIFIAQPLVTELGGGTMLILCALTCLTLLADRLPWLDKSAYTHNFADVLRIVSLMLVSLVMIVCLVIVLFQTKPFAHWLGSMLQVPLSSENLIWGLLACMVGWCAVVLGLSHHLLLPILGIPSLFALAFVSGLPAHVLAVPFAALICLSLTGQRRLL